MSALEDIEATLQARWDREMLEVYADMLQARGDPRGHLLALALAGTPDATRLRQERQRLVDAWVDGFQHDPPAWMTADTGFVTIGFSSLAGATAFLASHLAAYLRRVRVQADHAVCGDVLDVLATRNHPWCVELDLAFAWPRDATPIADATIGRVAEAMPNAKTLRLGSERMLHAPVPPSIKGLVLGAHDAIIGRLPMPNIEEVELTFRPNDRSRRAISELLHPHIFPGLRRLDLAASEGQLADVFAILDHVAAIERLSSLRLPSLRTESDLRGLRRLLDRVPGLEIEIARSHRSLRHLVPLDEPRLRVAEPVPCPPHDELPATDNLMISVPGYDRQFAFCSSSLADNTECYYAERSSEQQAAWTALWNRIETLGPVPVGFPAAAMAQVVETMMLTDCDAIMGLAPWAELERILARSPCSVLISRVR